jgi:hypothetical protein
MGLCTLGHGVNPNLSIQPVPSDWDLPYSYLDNAAPYGLGRRSVDPWYKSTWTSLRRWIWLLLYVCS